MGSAHTKSGKKCSWIQVAPGYSCLRLPCIQQETILLQGTGVSGFYVFMAVPTYTTVKGYHVVLLQVACKKKATY